MDFRTAVFCSRFSLLHQAEKIVAIAIAAGFCLAHFTYNKLNLTVQGFVANSQSHVSAIHSTEIRIPAGKAKT